VFNKVLLSNDDPPNSDSAVIGEFEEASEKQVSQAIVPVDTFRQPTRAVRREPRVSEPDRKLRGLRAHYIHKFREQTEMPLGEWM